MEVAFVVPGGWRAKLRGLVLLLLALCACGGDEVARQRAPVVAVENPAPAPSPQAGDLAPNPTLMPPPVQPEPAPIAAPPPPAMPDVMPMSMSMSMPMPMPMPAPVTPDSDDMPMPQPAPPAASGDVCERWATAHADLSEGTWSGDASSCDPGDMTPEARDNALRLVNLYRVMAGVPEVGISEEGNRLAQACALIMQANNTLTHMPDPGLDCYTEDGARGANGSSISPEAAVASVDGYMIDPGNPTTLGHRRWILSNMLSAVGFGSTSRYSCQWQPPGRPSASAKPWVAWPPEGEFPVAAFGNRWQSLDGTGWSLQSDTIDLNSAQVTVTVDGTDRPVTTVPLASGYGSRYAIRFNAMGWQAAAGETYHVSVSGIGTPIEYDVQIVACP